MPFFEYFFLYLLGSLGYGCLEILWRGWTHWTMLLTGGCCLVLIYWITNYLPLRLWCRWLLCGSSITVVEYLVGLLVNVHLGWRVWDYSHMFLNLSGQVCLLFSCYWLLLSIPFLPFCQALYRCLHGHAKPFYVSDGPSGENS